MNHLLISHSLQNVELEKEIDLLKEELDFYKSIFKTHQNSVIFNLKIKNIDDKKVWIDPIRCDRQDILDLNKDKEVEEWLRPIRPSR